MNQINKTISRGPGRRPADSTSELDLKILATAESLFSNQGFAATSIRQIADQAMVNPALVHYYFGNKKELLNTVLQRVLEPMAAGIAALPDDLDHFLEALLNVLFDNLAAHPDLARLLVREGLLPGGAFQQEFATRFAPRLGGALPPRFKALQDKGQLHASHHPGICALHMIALCAFPFLAHDLATAKLEVDFSGPGIEILKQQTLRLLREGYQV